MLVEFMQYTLRHSEASSTADHPEGMAFEEGATHFHPGDADHGIVGNGKFRGPNPLLQFRRKGENAQHFAHPNFGFANDPSQVGLSLHCRILGEHRLQGLGHFNRADVFTLHVGDDTLAATGEFILRFADNDFNLVELRDGENGPVRVRIWRRRVWIWPKASEIPVEVWMLVSVRADGGVKYSLSNAEADIPFEDLGKRQGQRHFVEVCFKDGKNYLGMAEYEGRGWTFWHHHMALVGVAMLFTVTERVGYKRTMPLLSVRDLVEVIGRWFASFLDTEDRERIVLKRH